jgi:hypothetical protein
MLLISIKHKQKININFRLKDNNHDVWVKPMEPIVNGEHSYAVVYLNRANSAESRNVSFSQYFN